MHLRYTRTNQFLANDCFLLIRIHIRPIILLIIILIYWIQNETDIFYIAAVNEQMIDFVNAILCWVNYNTKLNAEKSESTEGTKGKKSNNEAVG